MIAQTVTYTFESSGSISPAFIVVALAIVAVLIVAMWKVFTKAGKPGWAAIVPIYNTIVLLEIIGRPIWWILLMFIPIANIVILIIIAIDLAKSFGRSSGFAVGLILLPYVFYLILGFGSASYVGPAAMAGGMTPPPPPPAPAPGEGGGFTP